MSSNFVTDGIRKRIYLDLFQRATTGVVAYVILIPFIFYYVDFFQTHPSLAVALTSLVVGICGLRILQIRVAEQMYQRHETLWLSVFFVSTCICAAILSTFFVLATVHPDFKDAYNLLILICAGISSAAITSLAPAPKLAIAQNLICLLPPVLVNLYVADHRGMGIAMTIYLGYNILMAMKINKEYLRAFSMEQSLEQQKQVLQVLSRTDPLTGLYNRGHFEALLNQAWMRAKRSKQQINFVMMDIDHFKHINDNYGHSCGDACLKAVAEIMTQHFQRGNDLYCRYGGEEFTIVILDDEFQNVADLLDGLRIKLASTPIEYSGSAIKLTASFGIASLVPSSNDRIIDLINKADAALYSAKENGRNRIEVYKSPTPVSC